MPSSMPAKSRYSWYDFAFGSTSFRLSPSYTRIFEKMLEFSGSLMRVSTANCAIIFSVFGAHGAAASELLRSNLS